MIKGEVASPVALDEASPPAELDSIRDLRSAGAEAGLGGIVGRSECMQALYQQMRQVGASSASVLIAGETGVGKELVARTLHELSPRRARPYVAVNCAAVPETLLESELFGYEKGAFTGAQARTPGYFERAHRGTLFLDEISAMPASQQVKLLRVLQENAVRRLGGDREIEVDLRIIAAMNVDPQKALRDGTLRSDLYYRLSVFTLHVPPLRERTTDVPLLADHFVKELASANGKVVTGLEADALDALVRYPWPGNIRELRNAIERAVILAEGRNVRRDELPASIRQGSGANGHRHAISSPKNDGGARNSPTGVVLRPGMTLEEAKRELILNTLEATGHNITEAARWLGISSRTIYNKIREWELPLPGDELRA